MSVAKRLKLKGRNRNRNWNRGKNCWNPPKSRQNSTVLQHCYERGRANSIGAIYNRQLNPALIMAKRGAFTDPITKILIFLFVALRLQDE
jgi:hypothetical protein